jgi:hypothetical protein
MEIREPMNAGDYQDRDIKAAFVALIELGQILKPFEKSYVIVGGSDPWLLLDHGKPPHLGTLDIDIGLNPEDLDDGQYATLVETLEPDVTAEEGDMQCHPPEVFRQGGVLHPNSAFPENRNLAVNAGPRSFQRPSLAAESPNLMLRGFV